MGVQTLIYNVTSHSTSTCQHSRAVRTIFNICPQQHLENLEAVASVTHTETLCIREEIYIYIYMRWYVNTVIHNTSTD